MKRKNKLILFYTVVAIIFMGTPVSLYMVKTTSEKIKTEQNADSDTKKQEDKRANNDQQLVYHKSMKNLWTRGAILFSLSAVGLLMYKNKLIARESETEIQ